jgi:hypothetical protein
MERFQTVPYNWIPAFAGMTKGSGHLGPNYDRNAHHVFLEDLITYMISVIYL